MSHLTLAKPGPGWPAPPPVRLQAEMGEPWKPCPQDAACSACRHPMRSHWKRNPACSECGCKTWRCPEGTDHRAA